VRHAFTALGLTWLAFLALAQPFQRLHFDLALGLAGGGWAGAVLLGRRRSQRDRATAPRWMRRLDLALFSLTVVALTLELGLRMLARALPTPLLTPVGAAPVSVVQRFRGRPGTQRFGFPLNTRGYYDEELARRPPGGGGRLIVAIGDSFNVGAVPHDLHYTTVLESLLGATVDNLGVAGIGPPEYAALVALEAAPLQPDAILVALFVGNDLDVPNLVAGLPDPLLRSWFDRELVLLCVLPSRLLAIARERRRLESAGDAARDVARVQGEQAASAFPWTVDPLLEEPTFSEETFLELETRRALAVCARVPVSFDLACRSLLEARRAAGDAPLLVMIIPDEFQVEDELWERVSERAGRPLERDRPQALLQAWLAEEQIPHLDLLPILRAAPPLADGRRHLYHARDTHWNARGNRIAAQALADFLLGSLTPAFRETR
jgi:hypothetical protein